MAPKPFPKRSPQPKRELIEASTVAGAVHNRVAPSVAAAFAGSKLAVLVSLTACIISIVALIRSC